MFETYISEMLLDIEEFAYLDKLNKGEIPIDIAKRKGFQDVIDVIEKYRINTFQ